MNIWLILGKSTVTGQWDVYEVLFSADLIKEAVEKLFEYAPDLNRVKVETWYREEGTDDACFYDEEFFYREDE